MAWELHLQVVKKQSSYPFIRPFLQGKVKASRVTVLFRWLFCHPPKFTPTPSTAKVPRVVPVALRVRERPERHGGRVEVDPTNTWMFPQNGGVSPKNGWWKLMKKTHQNGWFGGKTQYFRKHPPPNWRSNKYTSQGRRENISHQQTGFKPENHIDSKLPAIVVPRRVCPKNSLRRYRNPFIWKTPQIHDAPRFEKFEIDAPPGSPHDEKGQRPEAEKKSDVDDATLWFWGCQKGSKSLLL